MMRTYRLRATADLRRLRGAASASRSTMRDCQPGPLAFQRKPGAEHGRVAGGGKLAGTVMPIEGDENYCREKL